MSEPAKVAGVAAVAGFSGWLLENLASGLTNHPPRYSQVFGKGNRVPFLPVYAAGGATLALLAPRLKNESVLTRFVVYGVALTGVEAISGLAERSQGRRSWDYHGSPIDLPHSICWSALAIIAEPLLRG